MRYMQKQLCSYCFSRYYWQRVKRNIVRNNMLSRHDKVGVGVSGGKDSLVTLYVLKDMHYDVNAICVDEGISGYRDKTIPYVERFCEQREIPLTIVRNKDQYGITIDDARKRDPAKPACSYCGVFRREQLNRTARELGMTKLATGHNLDDEVQVILMNFFRGEVQRMARTGPVAGLVENELFVPRIKPLRDSPEKENVVYALVNGIEYDDIECPYSTDAFRRDIRNFMNQMEEKRPGTKFGILNAYDRMLPILQSGLENISAPLQCEKCGELTSSLVCKKCEMLQVLQEAA